jgi:hypothetical protein
MSADDAERSHCDRGRTVRWGGLLRAAAREVAANLLSEGARGDYLEISGVTDYASTPALERLAEAWSKIPRPTPEESE